MAGKDDNESVPPNRLEDTLRRLAAHEPGYAADLVKHTKRPVDPETIRC